MSIKSSDSTVGYRAKRIGFTLTKSEEKLVGFSKHEIERILKASFNSLERREIAVRKILSKFQDQTSKRKKVIRKDSSSEAGKRVETDVDAKCRLVLREIDRAIANSNQNMDSGVLHANVQRFPTQVLRLELEQELDRLLMSQVKERERNEMKGKSDGDATTVGDSDASDSDEEALLAREAKDEAKKVKKKTSYQTQKDRIRYQKESKSVAFRQREMIKHELGKGGCVACRVNPCAWTLYMDTDNAKSRLTVLHDEIERVKICTDDTFLSRVTLTAMRQGGPRIMKRSDAFTELTREHRSWTRHLKLNDVDEEFHNAHVSDALEFDTKSLHGFVQTQLTVNVRSALEREHGALVAQITGVEIVEDILEGMLEGWIFGQRQSERKALGYVPSLKREGPLTYTDLRRLDKSAARGEAAGRLAGAVTKNRILEQEGTPLEKWVPIELQAITSTRNNQMVQNGKTTDHVLTETEQALKFGLFCMTLMYFRGLSLLRKQKETWGGKMEETSSSERIAMRNEERKTIIRTRKIADYKDRVALVRSRKTAQDEDETFRLRQILYEETRQGKREDRAVVMVRFCRVCFINSYTNC